MIYCVVDHTRTCGIQVSITNILKYMKAFSCFFFYFILKLLDIPLIFGKMASDAQKQGKSDLIYKVINISNISLILVIKVLDISNMLQFAVD